MTATVPGLGARLDAAIGALADVVEDIDADCMLGADARRLAEGFAQGARLCEAGLTLMAARVATSDAWKGSEHASPDAWLAATARRSRSWARRILETGKRVEQQPEVSEQLRSGGLSSEQAEEVSAAAKEAPGKTEELLDQAKSDPSMQALRNKCREARMQADSEAEELARHRRTHAGRHLRSWTDSAGAGRLDARMTTDALARILAQLRPFEDQVFEEARRDGRREQFAAYSLDALLAMADAATDALCAGGRRGSEETAGPDADEPLVDDASVGTASGYEKSGYEESGYEEPGDGLAEEPTRTEADGDVAGRRRGEGRPGRGAEPDVRRRGGRRRATAPATVLARIDLAALRRGWAADGEMCEIEGVGRVPVAVVREWTLDAFMALVVTDGTDIRSVVHLGRYPTAAQRSALLVRDVECVVPGCHVRRGLEIDHVDPWVPYHVTRLDRLARLCRRHHRMKTYERWRLSGGPGGWNWDPPGAAGASRPPGGGQEEGPPTTRPDSGTGAATDVAGQHRSGGGPIANRRGGPGSLFDACACAGFDDEDDPFPP